METEGSAFAVGPVRIVMGGQGSTDVSSIQAHDPGFDATNFLAWVEQVHFAMVRASGAGEPQEIRRYVAASLYPRLSAQITASKQAPHPPFEPVAGDVHPGIHAAQTDASFDTVVVRLRSAVAAPGGAPGLADWTFQRSASATTPAGGLNATATGTCAGCGAPLKLDAAGDCVYCKAPAAASATDWVLVAMEAAAPDPFLSGFSAPQTVAPASGCLSRVWVIGVVVGVLGVVAAIVIPIATTTHSINKALSSRPSISFPVAAPTPSSKTVTPHLTLSGAINLAPSTLNKNEVIINGRVNGACSPANQAIKTVVLNVTFDSGAKLQGAFTLPPAAAPSGPVDLSAGGTAALHYVGATQATNDDQTWIMSPGTAGAVTFAPAASGGGTLKWQDLPAGEATHNHSDASSGLLTWTCA